MPTPTFPADQQLHGGIRFSDGDGMTSRGTLSELIEEAVFLQAAELWVSPTGIGQGNSVQIPLP